MPESLKERLKSHETLLSQKLQILQQIEKARGETINEVIGLRSKVELLRQLVKDIEKPEESKKVKVKSSKSRTV